MHAAYFRRSYAPNNAEIQDFEEGFSTDQAGESSLNLPGFTGQQVWGIKILTDIVHHSTPPGANCRLTIGTNLYPLQTMAATKLDIELSPGVYKLLMACSSPDLPVGCKGIPGKSISENERYEITIDATRKHVSGTR
jgi:hypothetical protein